jgi:hypothetical protein
MPPSFRWSPAACSTAHTAFPGNAMAAAIEPAERMNARLLLVMA